MAVGWSGLASEVLLTLDRGCGVPLLAQLEDQFRQAVRSGRLGAGERVPSSRALAKALGLSRGLAQECHAQLLAEGYLPGLGPARQARRRPRISGPERLALALMIETGRYDRHLRRMRAEYAARRDLPDNRHPPGRPAAQPRSR